MLLGAAQGAAAARDNLGSHPDTAVGIKVLWPSVPNGLTFRKMASSNKYQVESRMLTESSPTIQSVDIVLPTTDGREIRLRRVPTLTAEQQKLLTELGMSLPDRLNLNFECSVDSATA